MADGGRHARARRSFLGSVVVILASGVPSLAQQASCDRYAIQGLSVGSTLSAVRAQLGREGVATRIARSGQGESSAVEYVKGDDTVYIEYDHRLDRKPEARIDLLRASIDSSADALANLEARWGAPAAGQEELGRGLTGGPAVWIDERCGLAVSLYRRQGSWWSGDVGAFVQLESLASVRRGDSPASAVLAARGAAVATPAPVPASPPLATSPPAAAATPAASSLDRPPERISYVRPAYPPNLRLMSVSGRVSLAVIVGAAGTVEDARVVEAVPAGRGFEEAAIAAVKRWKYRPATSAGQAVAVEIPVVIEFQ
jgi:TonB family protein